MHYLIFGLYKDPKVSVLQANAQLVQRGYCWTWNQRLIRGLGSVPARGNIFYKFCNHNLHNIAGSDKIRLKTENPVAYSVTVATFQTNLGLSHALPPVQILSFSCSFLQKV